MNVIVLPVFLAAALLEVCSDAVIRRGLRGHKLGLILAGAVSLACYGLLVTSIKWDFSKLLGVYVGFFALISVLFGKFVFQEHIPSSTWLGLGVILAGCAIIQFGKF